MDLGLQAGPVFGSREFHETYYTVRPDEALPDRPAYAARGGYGGMMFTAALSRRDGRPLVRGLPAARPACTAPPSRDSPLVRQRQSWSAGLAVSWILKTSSRPGIVEDAP